jgi:GAF domain-containing protein
MMAGARHWRAADYVLEGAFCPIEDVRAHLDRLRRALGARALIHIAADGDTVLRSLCFSTGLPLREIRHLNDALRSVKPSPQFMTLCGTMLDAGQGQRIRCLTADEASSLISTMRNSYPGLDRPIVADGFLTDAPWAAFTLVTPESAGNGLMRGAIQSVLLISPPAEPQALERSSGVLDGLRLRLRATAVAANRHDSLVMAMVTEKLRSSLVHTEANLGAALDLAVSVTNSDGGAVYMMYSAKEVVYRAVAKQGNANLVSEIKRNSDSAVSWSVEHHRPYQISPQLGAAARPGITHPPTGVELVTPIPGPLASPATPAVGVLALYRLEQGREFRAYEQALARNVALRMALMHATKLSGSLALAIGALDDRPPVDRSYLAPKRSRRGGLWLLPDDYQEVLDRIDRPLAKLCEATYSQSVTMRLALPDPRSQASHGLTLVRCAAHPRIRMRDKRRALREREGGIAWSVMRRGEHEDVRDVAADRRFLQVRAEVASEFCVPVKVQGTTIGTLNLESPIRDNYAASLPLVLAFAGALGRAFEEAASARAKQVIDQAALSIAKRHAIDNYVTDLQRSLSKEEVSDRGRRALDRFAQRARQTLSEMRGKAVIEAVGTATLREVVQSSLLSLDTTLAVPEIPASHPFDAQLDPLRATATSLALTNLFQNAISHVDPIPRGFTGMPQRRVAFSRTYLDGAECAVIAIENQIRLPLPSDRLAGLYHYPLTGKNDELRLGAFLAGLAAQRVGGRLHAYQSPEAQTLTSVLIIPGKMPRVAL